MKIKYINDHQLEIKEMMDSFIEKHRPPKELRAQVDLVYKTSGQSIVIFELRSKFDAPEEKIESYIAKTTFVKKSGQWKIYWLQSDLKWHAYEPKPTVNTVKDFTNVVSEDLYGCFFG